MALEACGCHDDPAAIAAGKGDLVNAVERALIAVRRITIREAARIAREHDKPQIGSLIERMMPEDE